jgi:hypothetical protein
MSIESENELIYIDKLGKETNRPIQRSSSTNPSLRKRLISKHVNVVGNKGGCSSLLKKVICNTMMDFFCSANISDKN